MTFVKAEPMTMPFKASCYGPPGSGKTLTALLMAEGLCALDRRRIAVVDTELGTKTYRVKNTARKVHPEPFDFDVLATRSLSKILEDVKRLDPEVHGAIILDSVSHIWDAAREAWEAKHPNEDDIPLRAWSSIKRPYRELMRFLIDAPFHVFILGRQKSLFEEKAGRLENIGVGMRAESETQYEPDTCFRFEQLGKRGEDEGVIAIFCEKDRYSVLSGRTFTMPTFKVLEALLPFIGSDAPPTEDDTERAERDGELLDGSEKAKEKTEKSGGIFADLQAKVAATTGMSELGAVFAEIKKLRRHLVAEHLNALRVLYEQRRDRLVSETAGDI
jgi:hypothetical protein